MKTLTIALALALCGSVQAQKVLELTGELQPRATVKVYARVAGMLEKINVRESDFVREGQVLAEIDPKELEIEVAELNAQVKAVEAKSSMMAAGGRPEERARSRAEVDQVQAVLREAEANHQRMSNLFARGGVPRQQVDAARRELDVARARVTGARKSAALVTEGARDEERRMARADLSRVREQLKMAELKLSYTKVRAPFSGVLGMRMVDPGTYVLAASSPQAPALFVLSDSKVMKGMIDVPESELMHLRVGQPAKVRVQSLPDKVFQATVSNVYPYVDPKTRNGKIELAVPNPQAELLSGMFIKAEIQAAGERAPSMIQVLGLEKPRAGVE
jgi:multidrug resistance efflux pump